MTPQWVALFRGINVGGRNVLPMKTLVAALAGIGAEEIRTYIQSGNVVFRHRDSDRQALEDRLRAAVEAAVGFRPVMLLIPASRFGDIAEANPLPVDPPNALHVFFLASPPRRPDLGALSARASAGERFELSGHALYLHAPAGFARSRLASAVERLLGVSATARNWRTVTKIRELCAA